MTATDSERVEHLVPPRRLGRLLSGLREARGDTIEARRSRRGARSRCSA